MIRRTTELPATVWIKVKFDLCFSSQRRKISRTDIYFFHDITNSTRYRQSIVSGVIPAKLTLKREPSLATGISSRSRSQIWKTNKTYFFRAVLHRSVEKNAILLSNKCVRHFEHRVNSPKKRRECVLLLNFFVTTGSYESIQIEPMNLPGCVSWPAKSLTSSLFVSNFKHQSKTSGNYNLFFYHHRIY